MNLRIPDPAAMVAFLHEVVPSLGVAVLSVEGWQVIDVDGRFFHHGIERTEVGGPYPTLGALLRDAGHRRHAAWSDTEPKALVWDVVAWGGAFFTVHTADPAKPTRHETLDAAVAAGGVHPGPTVLERMM